jgi:hypothetical protein
VFPPIEWHLVKDVNKSRLETGWPRRSISPVGCFAIVQGTGSQLNNARDWHPSVVANLAAMHDLVLDRLLMRVGMGAGETAAIDALAAYQFCAMWMARDPNPAYAEYAAFRVLQMKLSTQVLRDVQRTLEAHFRTQAPSS